MTKKSRPFTVRLSNELLNKCEELKINKTEACRVAIEIAISGREIQENIKKLSQQKIFIEKGEKNVSEGSKKGSKA